MDKSQLLQALWGLPDETEILVDADTGYNSVTNVSRITVIECGVQHPNSRQGKYDTFHATENPDGQIKAVVLRWNP